MKGVTFDDFHSFEEFRLILSSKTIEAPSAKTAKVSIDGADGEIDLTEYFGETKYNNRKLEFNFSSIVPTSEFLEQFSEINNAIHGKNMKIILDDDSDFYYIGRCSLSAWKSNGRVIELTISCDCEPYKYKLYPTKKTDTISGTETITYSNLRKSVVPKITTNGAIDFVFEDKNFSVGEAGTYIFPDVVFRSGANKITFTGNAIITVEYQEGGL